MGYTKRQLVQGAFEEIGMADYVFDLQPEQLQGALRRLDGMMAEWTGRGVSLGYMVPSSPENSDITEDSGIPDWASTAVILNLACRIAPGYGKMVLPQTQNGAKQGLDTVMNNVTKTYPMQYPSSLPVGAGWKSRTVPFNPPPVDTVLDKPEPALDFEQ
jgi:hypothetical protein